MPVAKGQPIDVGRTKRKVVRAATDLFYRRGTLAGVDELAKRAGVSKLTIYRHFGSKDGLLEEVLRQRSDRVVAWLRESGEAEADPVERVLAVFDALRGWYAERSFRGCAIVNAAAQDPAARGPARRIARVHLRRHRELLAALAADAGAADPELAGRQLLILLEGATVVAAVCGDLDAAEDARRAARALLADA